MTAKQLIAALDELPPLLPVMICYDIDAPDGPISCCEEVDMASVCWDDSGTPSPKPIGNKIVALWPQNEKIG